MKTATSKDWKIKPLPKKRSLIPVDRQFTSAEMNRIRRGFIPLNARWFIFFERNRLYFHRSWTGYCVFVAHFKRRQDGHVLHLIEANRDRRQYSETNDARDARLCFNLLDNFLLNPQAQSNENKGPVGLMAALDQASKENYLGDPKVVSKLLRDFSDEALRRRASEMDDEEARICDEVQAAALADIFLGKNPDYAPMIPWNSPGQIDRWLADELKHLKVTAETPELTVANVMHWILKDMFGFADLAEEEKNWNIGATLENFTNVMLGISIYDDDEEAGTDTLSVAQP